MDSAHVSIVQRLCWEDLGDLLRAEGRGRTAHELACAPAVSTPANLCWGQQCLSKVSKVMEQAEVRRSDERVILRYLQSSIRSFSEGTTYWQRKERIASLESRLMTPHTGCLWMYEL